MPEISLAIPVHNSSEFLDELFECLRKLDPLPSEIIFLDDASTDASIALIEKFMARNDLRISPRLIRCETNLGIAGAYNQLAREAQSEWLQILDADDLLCEPDFFLQVRPALTPKNDIVVTGLTSNSGLLQTCSRLLAGLVSRHPPLWLPLLGSFATRSGVIYRRQRLANLPFTDPVYPGSDVIHFLQMREGGRCEFLRRPKVFYRLHSSAQSSTKRNYTRYRRNLAHFPRSVRLSHRFDIRLRQLVQAFTR